MSEADRKVDGGAQAREHHARLKEAFARLAALDPSERERAIVTLRVDDPKLASDVEELLAAEETLDAPALESPRLQRQIGHYRLLERLGSGGMGEVFLAEQLEPVRRKVALKLVREGLDSQDVLARFEGERQALALMDHPAIASVFDAGTTEGGRPYFVMEFVAGQPIQGFCDAHQLDQRQRIELFQQVCDGVAHAHLKGVIHRDLKPSNVLVREHRGAPGKQAFQVKIIDFGIAKATSQRLTERTLHTEIGRVVGTPEYMSPEQASATPLDVDVRSDVYSLGVMLYELLVGVRPFEGDIDTSGLEELRRRLNEEDPVRPSTRVSSLGASRADLWKKRRTKPEEWARQLRGDLDWICLKALERDRLRRYQSVADLAEDLRRSLADEPVLAGPPSMVYRAGKFARRHRAGVAAAAFALVFLIAGVVGVLFALDRAIEAEERASAEAESANQVVDFLVDVFQLVDPMRSPEDPVDARELVDRGLEKARTDLAEQPVVRARLLDVFGSLYQNLGDLEGAEVFEEAVELTAELSGDTSSEYALALANLGNLRSAQGRLEEAERLTRQAKLILDAAPRAAAEDRILVASRLASVLIRTEQFEDAEASLREAIALTAETKGAQAWELVQLYNNVAVLDFEREDYESAAEHFETALGIARETTSDDHPWIASMLNNLGGLYFQLEQYERGMVFLRDALVIREKLLPDDHPDLGLAYSNLAQGEIVLGNYEEAEQLLDRATMILEQVSDPLMTAYLELNRGLLHREQDRWNEAVVHYRRALEIRRQHFADGGPMLREALLELATTLEGTGDPEDAAEAAKLREEAVVD